jgi:hypothetical protein
MRCNFLKIPKFFNSINAREFFFLVVVPVLDHSFGPTKKSLKFDTRYKRQKLKNVLPKFY